MRRRAGVLGAVLLSALAAASAAEAGSWSIEPTPTPAGAQTSELLAVSCTTPNACTAVGDYRNSGGVQMPLAERWDGTSWVIQPTPSPAGAVSSSLAGVSCTTASQCVAVGEYATQSIPSTNTFLTLVERWNGTTWSIEPSPNPLGATSSSLQGVACVTGACTAVGSSQPTTSSSVPLAERWDGRGWSIQPTVNPAGSTSGGFAGVSCPNRQACTAVGNVTGSAGFPVTLAEAWNGRSWALQPTPNVTGAEPDNMLDGVSCAQVGACTAVGLGADLATLTGGFLAINRTGDSWTVKPTPSLGAQSGFGAVACPKTTNCTAAGSYTTSLGGTGFTAVEHWNGTSWTVQSTPNPSGAHAPFLVGVSCPTEASCQAVGGTFRGFGFPQAALAEGFS